MEFKSGIFSSYKNYEQMLATYFVKSTLVTMRKFDKLHEDLQFDLQDEMNKLLNKIYKGNTRDIAQELKLPEQI